MVGATAAPAAAGGGGGGGRRGRFRCAVFVGNGGALVHGREPVAFGDRRRLHLRDVSVVPLPPERRLVVLASLAGHLLDDAEADQNVRDVIQPPHLGLQALDVGNGGLRPGGGVARLVLPSLAENPKNTDIDVK